MLVTSRFLSNIHFRVFSTVQKQSRPFFASSTDHSRLLAEAEIHSWKMPPKQHLPPESTIYVLAASGMTTEMVQKVPQLHLARLYIDTDNKTIYGAKVVNRTLGNVHDVCARLLSRALADSQNYPTEKTATAKSTLHGLSDHVLSGKSDVWNQLAETEQRAVEAMARNHANLDMVVPLDYWHALAKEFVHSGKAVEANLYLAQGATLESILDHEDTSEFASTCGGAMAFFQFKQ